MVVSLCSDVGSHDVQLLHREGVIMCKVLTASSCFAAGVASFHGSPLLRNGSTFKQGTNVTDTIFNGYNDLSPGTNAKAKADVQARTQQHMQPCQREAGIGGLAECDSYDVKQYRGAYETWHTDLLQASLSLAKGSWGTLPKRSHENVRSGALPQAELDAANATWSFTDYSHTTHAFTLPSNPLWTSGPARALFLFRSSVSMEECGAVLSNAWTADTAGQPPLYGNFCILLGYALYKSIRLEASRSVFCCPFCLTPGQHC